VRPVARTVAACVLATLALTGCSGARMTPEAAEELQVRVVGLRAAAGSGSRAVADAALAELRATVKRLIERGALEAGKASDILEAASAVEATLDVMPTTTTTTRPPPDDDDGPGRGRGRGGDDDD
jgi:hypothetical protein